MLKLACYLTGDNFTLLNQDTPASKKKVAALAIALMVPVLIWIFNGFMLSYKVLQSGMVWSIITALACGLIIFCIEKLIIMANGNMWLNLFRVIIGLVVALLGSLAIDEVIFDADIDMQVKSMKQASILKNENMAIENYRQLNNSNSLEMEIGRKKAEISLANEAVIKEADGSGGTKERGIGDITKLKQAEAASLRNDLAQLLTSKQLDDAKGREIKEKAGLDAALAFNEHALLTRIWALFDMLHGNTPMIIAYTLFTILMFSFEFLVVILKSTWKKTNYEARVEMIDEIGKKRMAFLLENGSPLLDPGNYLPNLANGRQMLRQKKGVYYS